MTTAREHRDWATKEQPTHTASKRELRVGVHLYTALDRLSYWVVVRVDDECEFYSKYVIGHFVMFDLYALNTKVRCRPKCETQA